MIKRNLSVGHPPMTRSNDVDARRMATQQNMNELYLSTPNTNKTQYRYIEINIIIIENVDTISFGYIVDKYCVDKPQKHARSSELLMLLLKR